MTVPGVGAKVCQVGVDQALRARPSASREPATATATIFELL
jgi:hypothetical protein